MLLLDVNVLVYTHRADAAGHVQYREWLERVLVTEPAFGMAELVLSGFLRVVTHPKVFREPSPLDTALAFAETLRNHSHCILVAPGAQHWEIFARLCPIRNAARTSCNSRTSRSRGRTCRAAIENLPSSRGGVAPKVTGWCASPRICRVGIAHDFETAVRICRVGIAHDFETAFTGAPPGGASEWRAESDHGTFLLSV